MCLCLQPKTVQKFLGREYLVCLAIFPLLCSCVHLLPEFHAFSNNFCFWTLLVLSIIISGAFSSSVNQLKLLVQCLVLQALFWDRFFSVFGLLRSLSLNLFHLSSELHFFCLAGETRFVAMGELHFLLKNFPSFLEKSRNPFSKCFSLFSLCFFAWVFLVCTQIKFVCRSWLVSFMKHEIFMVNEGFLIANEVS